MKNSLFKTTTFLLLVLAIMLTNVIGVSAHTLLTPNGSSVSHGHFSDTGWGGYSQSYWTSWSDNYYAGLYLQRIDRANQAYNCHSYAWANSRQSSSSSWCWIGTSSSTDENIYWDDNSYNSENVSNATHVSYGDTKNHSLLLTGKIVSGRYEVTSKWGKLPVYRHLIWSDPYMASSSDTTYFIRSGINYKSHVANIGWQNWVSNGELSGTTGQYLRMEAIRIKISGLPSWWNVEYRVHVSEIGWLNWVRNGEIAGTTGQSRQMEAIQIRLLNAPSNFTVRYRAHVKDLGWMSWVSNGQTAGTTGQSRQMEAIQIELQAN